MQRPSVERGLHRNDKGRVAAPTPPNAFTGAFATDVGVVNLDPWPGGAELVTAVTLDHRLRQLVLNLPSGVGRDSEPPAQLDVGQAFLALSEKMHGAKPHPHRQLGALEDGAAISDV